MSSDCSVSNVVHIKQDDVYQTMFSASAVRNQDGVYHVLVRFPRNISRHGVVHMYNLC